MGGLTLLEFLLKAFALSKAHYLHVWRLSERCVPCGQVLPCKVFVKVGNRRLGVAGHFRLWEGATEGSKRQLQTA